MRLPWDSLQEGDEHMSLVHFVERVKTPPKDKKPMDHMVRDGEKRSNLEHLL